MDRTILFTQLAPRIGDAITGTENLFDLSLSQALGTVAKTTKFDFASSKLGKVYLTSFNTYYLIVDVFVQIFAGNIIFRLNS